MPYFLISLGWSLKSNHELFGLSWNWNRKTNRNIKESHLAVRFDFGFGLINNSNFRIDYWSPFIWMFLPLEPLHYVNKNTLFSICFAFWHSLCKLMKQTLRKARPSILRNWFEIGLQINWWFNVVGRCNQLLYSRCS